MGLTLSAVSKDEETARALWGLLTFMLWLCLLQYFKAGASYKISFRSAVSERMGSPFSLIFVWQHWSQLPRELHNLHPWTFSRLSSKRAVADLMWHEELRFEWGNYNLLSSPSTKISMKSSRNESPGASMRNTQLHGTDHSP